MVDIWFSFSEPLLLFFPVRVLLRQVVLQEVDEALQQRISDQLQCLLEGHDCQVIEVLLLLLSLPLKLTRCFHRVPLASAEEVSAHLRVRDEKDLEIWGESVEVGLDESQLELEGELPMVSQ